MPPVRIDDLQLDRTGFSTLADQIAHHIETAIVEGALQPGGRLPSWRDLAAQLGVARGTVKTAYDKLTDRGLLTASGAAGTRVSDDLSGSSAATSGVDCVSKSEFEPRADKSLAFRMGVPAHDAFPAMLWSRLHRRAVKATALWTGYSDPCGLLGLRAAIASHVALARGIECAPDQVIVTNGYRGGLALALHAMGATGRQAWIEDPAYPPTRSALDLAGIRPIAVPVDREGIDVARGIELAPQAAFAIVTPGQQAPTGVTLSSHRRSELLAWASASKAWIIEDDYLAELHLNGKPANALAALETDRVIHAGTFSKTLAPLAGIGFVIAPAPLVRRLVDVATWLAAPPGAAAQLALADFLREGHYLRHLRRMRHLYGQRRQRLLRTMTDVGIANAEPAGLSVLLHLPNGFDDEALCVDARSLDLHLAPLSPWFADASRARSGVVLGIANVLERKISQDCERLEELIRGKMYQKMIEHNIST